MIQYGSEAHVTTVLPLGKKQHDYIIEFEITVTDSLSAFNSVLLHIKVIVFNLLISILTALWRSDINLAY